MAVKTIPYSTQLGFSQLTRDFIYNPEKTERFFGDADFATITKSLSEKSFPRDTAVDILMRQNQQWAAGMKTRQNIEKLRQSKSVAVFTGQQACLFGGPYLVLLKALAAVKWAEKLERELSTPVVPIFWIASDDHDIQEIASVDIFDVSGKIVKLHIDAGGDVPSPPIGALTYDESVEREVAKLADVFPDNDFKAAAYAGLADEYKSGVPVADAFARYLHRLTAEYGLVLFNPYDDEFKRASVPFMTRIIDKHSEMKKALNDTESALTGQGYHLQVEKSERATHLFFHDPGRTAIHRDGEGFIAGGRSFTKESLCTAIMSRPLDFSPDVFTRALIQSHLFPAAAIICGPAEVAYYAQMMSLFDVYGLVRPRIILRPSATIIENRDQALLESHSLTFQDITGDFEAVINALLSDTFPERLDSSLSSHRQGTKNTMEELRRELVAYDANLTGMIEHTEQKIDYLLGELAKKVFSAHKKKNKVERGRLYRLRDHLWPGGMAAERSIAPAYFISRYGPGIIDFLYENARIDETGHQLLRLSDYDG